MNELNATLAGLTPKSLAELSVLISKVIGTNSDFITIHKLANAAFDAGIKNCGDDFADYYFDAIVKYESIKS